MFTYRIELTGTPDHQRFMINRGDNYYWSGDSWTPRLKDAVLYATHQDACRAFKPLAETHFQNKPIREFFVLTKVKVYAEKSFTNEDLQEYLSSTCTLVLTPGYRGYGPVEDSFTQVEISWDGLQETRSGAEPLRAADDQRQAAPGSDAPTQG